VAGPVRADEAKFPTCLVIDAKEVATQLRLASVGLLNDLEAYAYGIDAWNRKTSSR